MVTELYGFGSIPLIMALLELLKAWVSDKRLYPLISVCLGIILNLLLAWWLVHPVPEAIIIGIISGLAACGLYSTGATLNLSPEDRERKGRNPRA